MRSILLSIGEFLSYIFPQRFVNYFTIVRRYLNTGYYRRNIIYLGKNSTIDYPCRLNGAGGIRIGDNVSIAKRVILTSWDIPGFQNPRISIGNNVSIGESCHITSINMIEIGNNVLLGNRITISDNSHGQVLANAELKLHPSKRTLFSKGPVIIKDQVWIGDKVTVLSGVTIGEN